MGMDELRAAVMYLINSFLVGHNFNYGHRKQIGIKSARLERDTGEASLAIRWTARSTAISNPSRPLPKPGMSPGRHYDLKISSNSWKPGRVRISLIQMISFGRSSRRARLDIVCQYRRRTRIPLQGNCRNLRCPAERIYEHRPRLALG